jgi:hypothetical protein
MLSLIGLRMLHVLGCGRCIVLVLCHANILLTWLERFCANGKEAVLMGFGLAAVSLGLPLGWNALWICLVEYPFFLKIFLW